MIMFPSTRLFEEKWRTADEGEGTQALQILITVKMNRFLH